MPSHFTSKFAAVLTLCVIISDVFGNTVITECNDSNLRAAVAAGGVITFACDGVIQLTNTIVVTENTEIDGTGRDVTISGGGVHRLFAMTNVTFKLKNVALVDGHSKGEDADHHGSATPGIGGAIIAEGGILSLEKCRFEGNRATGGNGYFSFSPGAAAKGGAIMMSGGVLTIADSEFIDNATLSGGSPNHDVGANRGEALGGAIAAVDSSLNITATQFVDNLNKTGNPGEAGAAAPAKGGALFLQGGSAFVAASHFERNASFETGSFRGAGAIGTGGAIYSETEMEVLECTFIENSTRGGGGRNGADGIGGAIASYDELHLEGSVFASNHVRGGNGWEWLPGGAARGGAVAAFAHTTILNCTFAGNEAAEPHYKSEDSAPALGGAIYLDTSDAELRYLTVSDGRVVRVSYSTAPTEGAGIYATSTSSATMQGVLLNNNFLLTKRMPERGPGVILNVSTNIAGNLQDLGHNLSSDDSGLNHATSLKNVDPVLGPLGNYGGLTMTLPLLRGSPAINSGGTEGIPAEDQRGRSRSFRNAADIGAYESSMPYFVAGTIAGAKGESLLITGASLNTLADQNGNYLFTTFPSGAHTITPQSDFFVFDPPSHVIQTDADVAGVNFRAYPIGAVTWDFEPGENSSIVFVAATAGEYEIQSSSNLESWGTLVTETLAERELHRVAITSSEEAMFFRVLMAQ